MKTLSLKEIADALNANLLGNPDEMITGINGIMEADKGDITFLANPKYKDHLPLCRASAVMVSRDVTSEGINLLQVDNPRLDYARVINLMFPPKTESGSISEKAFIAATAQIGKNCSIYPNVYIGENTTVGKNTVIYPGVTIGDDVTIGDNCFFYANVAVNRGCRIGNRVIFNAGCVIGSEGFGFEREKDGDPHIKVPQVGIVIIEDDVEVGALCAIDRGSIKATVIGRGTKFDNLVHIAHNCQVGEDNLLMAQTLLAGSVKTGRNVWFAGQAACLDHLKVADHVKVFGRGGVTQNIDEAGLYAGFPTRPFLDWQKASAMFYKTDDQRKKLSALEKRIRELEEKLVPEKEA
ncbi:MAG: UDP-3-O-(3-hydroxymyristoyl)glucosamine N-acyltransferase [bacterium]